MATPADAPVEATEAAAEPAPEFVGEAPVKPRRSRRKAGDEAPVAPAAADASAEPVVVTPDEADAAKPRRRPRRKPVDAEAGTAATPPIPAASDEADDPADATPATGQDGTLAEADADPSGPPRRGWWQRTFGA